MWALDHGDPVSGIDADPVKLKRKIRDACKVISDDDPNHAIYRITAGGNDGPMPVIEVPEGFERVEKSSASDESAHPLAFGEQTPPAYRPGGALYKARTEAHDHDGHGDGCRCDGAHSL